MHAHQGILKDHKVYIKIYIMYASLTVDEVFIAVFSLNADIGCGY